VCSTSLEHPEWVINLTYWQAHCGPDKKVRKSFRSRERLPRLFLLLRTLIYSRGRFSFRGHSAISKIAPPFEDTQMFLRRLLLPKTPPLRELSCSQPFWDPLHFRDFRSEQDSYNNCPSWSSRINSYRNKPSWFSCLVTQSNFSHVHNVLGSYGLGRIFGKIPTIKRLHSQSLQQLHTWRS